jgi:tetratricopeptide (TPR) repeat protein
MAVVVPLVTIAVIASLQGKLPNLLDSLSIAQATNSKIAAATPLPVTPPTVRQAVPAVPSLIPSGTPTPTATPNPQQLIALLGTAWFNADWPLVIKTLDALLKIAPDNQEYKSKLYTAHLNYSQQLLAAGQNDRGVEELLAAQKTDPTDDEAKRLIAALTATPTPNPGQLLDIMYKSWTNFDWPGAISALEALLKVEPENADYNSKLYSAHISYGQVLLKAGQKDKAVTEFLAALKINSNGDEAKKQIAALTPTAVATP